MTGNGLCRLPGASKPGQLPGYHPAAEMNPGTPLSQGGASLLEDDELRVSGMPATAAPGLWCNGFRVWGCDGGEYSASNQ